MLDILRKKHVNKIILWVIAVIIILSFGVFGTAYRLDNTINTAGNLYGHNVPIKDFEKAYLDARQEAIMLYGDRFFKVSHQLNLEQEAWDRLILMKEAQKRNLTVSDKDVVDFIAAISFFQREGKFDQFLYQTIVKNPSIFNRNTRDFEEGIRKHLIIRKLLDGLTPSAITDEELKKEFQHRNEKLTLSYVLLNAEEYGKSLPVSDDEITKFYEERQEQFRMPPTINLDYVQLTFPDKATDEQKTKVQQQAKAIAAELNPKADFTAVAKKHNLDLKQSGPFTLQQPLLTFASTPEVTEKLFAMRQGEYSKALEVPDGYQVVQIKEKKDSAVPPLETIKDIVKLSLQTQKGFDAAKVKAEESLKALRESIKTSSFKTAAEALGLKVEQTPAFGRKEFIANVGIVREFQQDAQQLNADNKLSDVIATSQGPAIIYLTNSELPPEDQFTAEKENFRQMMDAERRNQAFITFMTQLRVKANIQSKIKHQ